MRPSEMPEVRRKYVTKTQRFIMEAAAEGQTQMRDSMYEDMREWQQAELYWVNAEMTQVALDAAQTVPPWTPREVMPSEAGFMYFDGQLPELPVTEIDPIPLNAFGMEDPEWRRPEWVAWCWRQIDGVRHLFMKYGIIGPAEFTAQPLPLSTYGQTNIPWEKDHLLDPDPNGDAEHPMSYATNLLLFMGAVWQLMKQPTVAVSRVDRVREQGAKKKTPPTKVNVVTLREMRYVEAERSESGRVYSHRWVVSGHWRQQRSGPGLSKVNAVWVPAYVKGPKGKPLIVKEKVMVWRR